MNKYQKYKESGIAWIGEIPEDWEVKKIKRLSIVKRGASPRPIHDPIYFDTDGEWAWVRIADVSASERYLKDTTQVLSELGASLSVKLLPGDFFLSIAGTVGKPIITKIKCCIHDGFVYFPYLNINPEFLYYIFSTRMPYQGLGKWGTQLNLNTDTVGDISIPLPDNNTIDEIVLYLDKKITEIDALIAQKEALLSLYEEEKAAIINQAVTKGIDPDVKMKESGMPWLGEIPEHWDVKRLKYLFKFVVGFTPPSGKNEYYDNGIYTWITIADMKGKYLSSSEKKITEKAIEDLAPNIVPKNSLLYSFKLSVGKVAFTKIDTFTNEAIFAVLPNKDLNLDYYYYSLPLQIIHNANENIYGAKIFNQELIKNAFLVAPPKDEQKQIVHYLEKELEKLENKIQKTKQIIKLQKEYRTALISEVVTGKIKVTEEA